jgi:uncharacterized coiled-coil protein SlyX
VLKLATSRTDGLLSSKLVPSDMLPIIFHMLSVVTDINSIVPEQQKQFKKQHDQSRAILERIKENLAAQNEHMKQVTAQLSELDWKGTLRDPQTLYPSHSLEPRKAASSLNDSR